MLRVVPHKSAAAGAAYYTEGLRREDYYSEGQEVVGRWHGKAAELLGISGKVTPDEFAALVENRHPVTGQKLTPRMKTDRVVGVDFNFHAPKSLSVVQAITGDKRIVEAFRSAVAETMAEIETMTETRVRKSSAQENRYTGNLAWAEFVHFTARPVGGIPDPHLHVHCFVFNATFDNEEGRWKAAKFRNLKANAPYNEAAFHARLSEKLARLGYKIERTPKGWEIAGIPQGLINRFSRRKAHIETLAEKRGIKDAKGKDALGAASRERKKHSVQYSELRAEWESRLSDAEIALIKGLQPATAVKPADVKVAARESLDYATEKLFEKNSVVSVNRLLGEAMRHGVGKVTPDAVWQEFAGRKMLVREYEGQGFCTSLDVLAEEVALINFVRTGRDRYAPLGTGLQFKSGIRLSGEQEAAFRHILESRDQVIMVRGAAGAGKTTMMKEAVVAIEKGGTKVFAFAQSADASRGTLCEAGFTDAQTIAHLLANPKLQREIRGHAIWIDESGLVGTRDMWEIMKVVGNDARVILTGDSAQHAPVARGDSFHQLQKYAGLKIAEITEIRRQERPEYKAAVSALSKGDLRTAFRRLDDLGAILEIQDDAERYRLLGQDYLESSRKGTLPLVVSPTHNEAAKVTDAIREARREAGELKGARSFARFHNLQWEEADRKRPENYTPGLIVQFHQNAKGVRRGEMFRVISRDEEGRVLARAETGREIALPLKNASRFLVYEERQIEIARGERIRITKNGESADRRRINNGNVFTVQRFTKDGSIVLTTGAVLDARYGHFRHGYCETSHASQSKTVRDVIVAQSADSFVASSREQFYVSVSRGKASIRIYTDDRKGLQDAVGNSSHRRSAIELAELSASQVSAFMANPLNAEQWRDKIRSRVAEGKAVGFVENVMKQRRSDGLAKPQGANFVDYLAMRRKIASADGKSRSKGHPSAPGKKAKGKEARGRSFIRPTSISTAPKQSQGTAAKKPEAVRVMQTKQSRLGKALSASARHFKSVMSRNGTPDKKPGQQLPKSNVPTAARHRVKQRATDAVRQSQIKGRIKEMNKAQKPPAPTPRRTK